MRILSSEWDSGRSRHPGTRLLTALLVVALASTVAPGCINASAVLTQLVDARRLASSLQVQFTQAADASNRAVMADTDEVAAVAAAEARRARQAAEQNLTSLQGLLQTLGYREDLRFLEGFEARFAEYRRLDDEILPLAVENTNVKAQRLSFGPAREVSDAFRSALSRALEARQSGDGWRSEALAARAVSAVLRVQVLQAPHIAEADLDSMTRMEGQMAAAEADARSTLQELKTVLPSSAAPDLAEAIAALDRFHGINHELIALSRRNSDVHSLALSLGRKRTVTADCEAQLRALEEALAKHEYTATR